MKEKIKEVLDGTNIKASNEIMILEYIDDLQERIDKAIEKVYMLKEHYFKEKVWGSNLDFDELLDILRGEDIK